MDELYDYYFKEFDGLSQKQLTKYQLPKDVEDPVDILCVKFPCRKTQIVELYNLYQDFTLVDSVYLYGCTSTGKSAITAALLNLLNIQHVIVNLIECYTTKILFEKILNNVANHFIDPTNAQPYKKCDNLSDFIINLKQLYENIQLDRCVIVLDKAERLRDMDANLLPAFTKFRELCNLEISIIFISELEFSKLIPKGGVSEPIEINFPQYLFDELVQILVNDFTNNSFLSTLSININDEEKFCKNYLNAFLSVYYWICRDLSELRYLAKKNFSKYCEPVLNAEISEIDSVNLWKNIVPHLKAELNAVYLRMNTLSIETNESNEHSLDICYNNQEEISAFQDSKKMAQNLELPFYAKYLLIAAYLASYNPAKEDKRLFMKYHGKKTKTKRQMDAKSKVSEQLNTQLGPKPFAFDRLLAIFYAILDEKVGLNSNLLVQVSSLVQLQLLSAVGDNTSLENQKYKCNVSFEFIQTVSKMVGFNIRKYLYDFI